MWIRIRKDYSIMEASFRSMRQKRRKFAPWVRIRNRIYVVEADVDHGSGSAYM